jgi:glycosyltransferase involved in cell wall biosynthesis
MIVDIESPIYLLQFFLVFAQLYFMVKNKENDLGLRALLLANDCNPDWPSIPAWTYKFARTIANYIDVVVVTQIRNKPNIDRDGMGKARVVYLDTEKIAAPLYKLAEAMSGGANMGMTIKTAMGYPSYLAFEWAAWKHFRQDLRNGQFDVVHRVSPLSPTIPSPIASWSRVPFLIGPINGGLPWPEEFKAEIDRGREWLRYFRKAYKLMPYYQSTYKCSAAILAGFDHSIAELPTVAKLKTINFPDPGLDPDLFTLTSRPKQEQMTILFVGRLVPYKLPEVVIRAFAGSSILRQHRLLIVGSGPARPRLEQMIEAQGLGRCVELLGQKTQAEVGVLMRQADIFAFPSICELGAGVVVEAMACGMACVVVDYGGPATLVQPDRGVKIPMADLNHLVLRFTEELEHLVKDPDRVAHLGRAAHHHAITYYSWDAKARKTLEIYNWVTGRQQVKPDFWDQPHLS